MMYSQTIIFINFGESLVKEIKLNDVFAKTISNADDT